MSVCNSASLPRPPTPFVVCDPKSALPHLCPHCQSPLRHKEYNPAAPAQIATIVATATASPKSRLSARTNKDRTAAETKEKGLVDRTHREGNHM